MIVDDPKKVFSLLLPFDTYEQVQKLAKNTERSIPSYIRQIIRIYLQYYTEHAQEGKNDPLIVK